MYVNLFLIGVNSTSHLILDKIVLCCVILMFNVMIFISLFSCINVSLNVLLILYKKIKFFML